MERLGNIIWHIVFTLNLLGAMAFIIGYVAQRFFSPQSKARKRFLLLSAGIVVLKVMYVLAYSTMDPEGVLSTDGERYLGEIQGISEAPWQWNPVAGTGPHYARSPKMGMSYVYGLILFTHRVNSLYGVLALNVFFSYLTCLMVMLLAMKLSDSPTAALVALFAAAVYPETLFWNARVVRENFTLFLTPALTYCAIRLRETYRIRYLALALGCTFFLAITRAQLSLFFLLIVIYFAAVSIWQADRKKTIVMALFLGVLGLLGVSFMKSQIKAAIGSELLDYLTLNPAFWLSRMDDVCSNLPRLLSVFARKGHGAMGVMLAPVFIIIAGLFVLTGIQFRQIFRKNAFAAGLLMFLVGTFLFSVSAFGLFSIRFRATVAPLVLAIIAVSATHYWQALRFPTLVLFHGRKHPSRGN
jgi:hypothetical protein